MTSISAVERTTSINESSVAECLMDVSLWTENTVLRLLGMKRLQEYTELSLPSRVFRKISKSADYSSYQQITSAENFVMDRERSLLDKSLVVGVSKRLIYSVTSSITYKLYDVLYSIPKHILSLNRYFALVYGQFSVNSLYETVREKNIYTALLHYLGVVASDEKQYNHLFAKDCALFKEKVLDNPAYMKMRFSKRKKLMIDLLNAFETDLMRLMFLYHSGDNSYNDDIAECALSFGCKMIEEHYAIYSQSLSKKTVMMLSESKNHFVRMFLLDYNVIPQSVVKDYYDECVKTPVMAYSSDHQNIFVEIVSKLDVDTLENEYARIGEMSESVRYFFLLGAALNQNIDMMMAQSLAETNDEHILLNLIINDNPDLPHVWRDMWVIQYDTVMCQETRDMWSVFFDLKNDEE